MDDEATAGGDLRQQVWRQVGTKPPMWTTETESGRWYTARMWWPSKKRSRWMLRVGDASGEVTFEWDCGHLETAKGFVAGWEARIASEQARCND